MASVRALDTQPEALVLTTSGPLTPAMSEYISRGIKTAEERGTQLIILQISTPGGSVTLMTQIVEDIQGSSVPIVVYVFPRGAIAGSAGTVITLAGHLSAMAPATAIGAASPVGSQGEDLGETIATKEKEAIKALIRTLTEGRPPEAVDLAEETVESAKAASASEAMEVGLVDFIASDVPDLLRQIDGRTVTTTSGEHTLNTNFMVVTPLNISFIEELLTILTNPNIVFILLTLGVQSILIELGSPGGWVAGFIGVVCLALAGYGLGVLPVNWFGIVFLIIAFVLFILDVKAPTHGALTTAGVGSFIIGALVLFNSPGTPQFFKVSVPLVVVSGLLSAASFFAILTIAIRAQRTPIRTGTGTLIGRTGIVRNPLPIHGQGKVHLSGEMWTAELAEGEEAIPEGKRVEVVEVEGIRLKVRNKPRRGE
jgi:membrane-bound serine protease (ClpP class)